MDFRFLVTFLSVGVFTTLATGQDFAKEKFKNWHHWRGPLATGEAVNANPPLTWDAKKNIKWKAELLGRGSATPIVWGDQVFVATAFDTGKEARPEDLPNVTSKIPKKTKAPNTYHRFMVFSFDRNTGKLLWEKTATEKVPHEGHHNSHSYAAGSPTTDGKSLYVSFGSFGIYCYDLQGNLRWRRDLGRLSTRLGWGEAVTPVIHGNDLIINWDQEENASLIVLDAKTGETRWKKEREERSTWSTPLVVEHQGITQVLTNGTERVRGYNLANGELLWQFAGMTINPIPSIVSADGVAYCLSGYQSSVGVAVPLDRRGELKNDDQFLWRINKGTPYVPSPLLVGDHLVFTQANVSLYTVLNRKTGKTLVDRERLPVTGQYYASPVAASGRIYLVNRDGTTLVLRDGDQLEVLATNVLGDPVDASPAIVGSQLFLRGEKYLYCVEGEK